MDVEKIFLFTIFPQTEWSNLPRPRPIPFVSLPTWECLEGTAADSWVPRWPGQAGVGEEGGGEGGWGTLHLVRVPAPPFAAACPHTRVYSSTENLASQKAPGIRLFSTLKVFI